MCLSLRPVQIMNCLHICVNCRVAAVNPPPPPRALLQWEYHMQLPFYNVLISKSCRMLFLVAVLYSLTWFFFLVLCLSFAGVARRCRRIWMTFELSLYLKVLYCNFVPTETDSTCSFQTKMFSLWPFCIAWQNRICNKFRIVLLILK